MEEPNEREIDYFPLSTVSALAELLKQDAALRGVFGEAEREKREVGEKERLLGTWVPFRLGPSSLRKPLKAANDPLPVPGWEAVSLLWLGEYRTCTQD